MFLIPADQKNPLGLLVAQLLGYEADYASIENFPDIKEYVEVLSDSKNRDVILFSTLNSPDDQFLPLILLSESLKDWKAKSVGLVCPFLPYLRPEKYFPKKIKVDSVRFAETISSNFDWIITINPEIYPSQNLTDIYSIPSMVIYPDLLISKWISENIENPIIIGVDIENEDWVTKIANNIKAPIIMLGKASEEGCQKNSLGLNDFEQWKKHTPVIIDEIFCDNESFLKTLNDLKNLPVKAPVCLSIHGLLDDDLYNELTSLGVGQFISCNTVPHTSNKIDITPLISAAIERMKGL